MAATQTPFIWRFAEQQERPAADDETPRYDDRTQRRWSAHEILFTVTNNPSEQTGTVTRTSGEQID